MKFICSHCGKEGDKLPGHVNRAKKLGMKLFCTRVCFGLNRRVERTEEEKKKIKKEYDHNRLNGPLREKILEDKRQYAKTEVGRASQKRNRMKRMPKHVEYCRQPKYKAYKVEYDKTYHAKKKYGEFYEAALILNDIETILLPQRHEVKVQKGTYNKSKQRKRHGTYRKTSQGITLGNPSRSTNW